MPIGKYCRSRAALLFLGFASSVSAAAQDAPSDRGVDTMRVTARVVATCTLSAHVSSVGSAERKQGGAGSFKVECTKGAAVGLGELGGPAMGDLHIATRATDVPLESDESVPGRRVATVLF